MTCRHRTCKGCGCLIDTRSRCLRCHYEGDPRKSISYRLKEMWFLLKHHVREWLDIPPPITTQEIKTPSRRLHSTWPLQSFVSENAIRTFNRSIDMRIIEELRRGRRELERYLPPNHGLDLRLPLERDTSLLIDPGKLMIIDGSREIDAQVFELIERRRRELN